MDKNWLIRTKSNHILGPISKEKVRELFKNGSIKPDDEVCKGNGFWFFIREVNMVERFIIGEENQSFNPISEAKDVLTNHQSNSQSEHINEDITLIGSVNLSRLSDVPTQKLETKSVPTILKETEINSPEENPIPDTIQESAVSKLDERGHEGPQKKNKQEIKSKAAKQTKPKPQLRKQGYLKFFAILGFIVLFLLIYFRKTVIRSLFHGEMTGIQFSLISPLHAQEILPVKKKLY